MYTCLWTRGNVLVKEGVLVMQERRMLGKKNALEQRREWDPSGEGGLREEHAVHT